MNRNRTSPKSRRNDAGKPAPQSAPDDDRSLFDCPRPADPMRASIAYSLRDRDEPDGAHIDVLRFSLVRKINAIIGNPARCKDPACRRAKACVGPTIRCDRDIPARQVTEKQGERTLAAVQRELRRRVEAREAAPNATSAKLAPGAASRSRSPASNRSA